MTFVPMIPKDLRRHARLLGFTPAAAGGVLAFHLGSTVFEGIGLGMVLPVFEYLQANENIAALAEKSELWRRLVDVYAAIGLPVTLAVLLGTSFLCILVRQAFVHARLVFLAKVRFRALARLQTLLFRNYLHVDLAYHEQQQIGLTVNDLTSQAERSIEYFFLALDFIGFAFLLLVYVVLLVVVSPEMAAAAAILLGSTAWALGGLLKRSRALGYLTVAARQTLAAFLTDKLGLLRLIRLSGAEAAEIQTVDQLTDVQRRRHFEAARLVALLSTSVEPIAAGAAILLLYFGVRVADLSLGTLGLFIVILVRLLPIVRQLLNTRQVFVNTEGAVRAITRRFQDFEAGAEHAGGGIHFEGLTKHIRFDNVMFTYPNRSAPALDHITLEIAAGTLTALVGPSGGGKSTLVDLLPRLREPTAGRVLIDDLALDQYDLQSLRAGIAFVPQAPLILNATPADHIRYGSTGATLDDVHAASQGAGADAFIRALPRGYDTPLGEGGAELSGGQRQRLDLARALLRQASILILDEPTSHLDADAERLFRETLLALRDRGDMSIVVIGHHLASITEADKIIVLANGQIAETGIHRTLLTTGNWYAQAYRKQLADSDHEPATSKAQD
ncbi:MAG: ABC transporter ATP-binding protein [Rhodospirillales bacterium]|nr:ABC transporter ATP-binding protein [Rhodospirillales bacterium]